jgi:hypothetical protein
MKRWIYTYKWQKHIDGHIQQQPFVVLQLGRARDTSLLLGQGSGEAQVAGHAAWGRCWSSMPARKCRCTWLPPTGQLCIASRQTTLSPTSTSPSRCCNQTQQWQWKPAWDGGGGGPAWPVAIRCARTCLSKVLAAGADEGPRTRLAGQPYQHRMMQPVTVQRQRLPLPQRRRHERESSCSAVQPEARVCGWTGHLQ